MTKEVGITSTPTRSQGVKKGRGSAIYGELSSSVEKRGKERCGARFKICAIRNLELASPWEWLESRRGIALDIHDPFEKHKIDKPPSLSLARLNPPNDLNTGVNTTEVLLEWVRSVEWVRKSMFART